MTCGLNPAHNLIPPVTGEFKAPRSLRFRILILTVLYTLCLWLGGGGC